MQQSQSPSIHTKDGWRGQYWRMIRWQELFLKTNFEDILDPNVHYQFDILYAFFQNAFFIRDWLIIDGNVSEAKVNDFIKNNIELGLCRDLCNGTKHYSISRPSVDGNFQILTEYNHFTGEWPVTLISDFGKYDLKDLAKKTVSLWSKFINDNGLSL
jgi:hypothetical protein